MSDVIESIISANSKRRILLVEDEMINQEILKMILEDDYEVICADNGGEALGIISSEYETLSIILLDLNLPDIHGLEVLKIIKSDFKYAKIPVIVMTADSEAEVESLSLGAIDFIPKPYPQPKVILARILRTIELSEDKDILRFTERDKLTGLYNKEFFYRYIIQYDTHHKDAPTDALVLDIDHFHMINERYGKAYCDELLKHIADDLTELGRIYGGIVCRSGADTFLVYTPHRSDYEHIKDILSDFLTASEGSENRVHLRMGVYECVDKTLDIERRFDRAKMAADTVRGSYTNDIGYYNNEMRDSEILAEQLIEDFSAAVNDKQFTVYYQPKFDIRENEPVLKSAEALVRWNHPKLGMISPGIFIPLFEENGLIQILDHFVWAETAAQIRDWKERYDVSLPVSVNVSRVDLFDPDIFDTLDGIVKSYGLDYKELLLEITESAYTKDSEQIVKKVEKLREMGFRIEMDDFGSGYSSLSMLSYLPIDALKLDMQFIRNAFKDRKDTRLLEAMIKLAASFGVPTIAEGVETAEQVFTLKMMGCDIIQGYYFSKPLPAESFERFIVEKKQSSAPDSIRPAITSRDRFTYNALHDPLTGLYNYTAFDILFNDSDREHIAVMLADIVGFDQIKRNRGREYADKLVCRIAEVMRANFRSVDHVCRLREDEFCIIMTRVTKAGRNVIVSKIESVLLQLRECNEGEEPVDLFVGVAFSDNALPEEDLFQNADVALKRQMAVGQNGYTVY